MSERYVDKLEQRLRTELPKAVSDREKLAKSIIEVHRNVLAWAIELFEANNRKLAEQLSSGDGSVH